MPPKGGKVVSRGDVADEEHIRTKRGHGVTNDHDGGYESIFPKEDAAEPARQKDSEQSHAKLRTDTGEQQPKRVSRKA